ncbi:MAG: GyrI-like domain-containing protein [Subdoligranulum sp.]|nr:GyrI-like domain-containing protein [Subdoligranulum sp.]
MEIFRCEKRAFSVIGKEGSTKDGEGFIQKLWEQANSHFEEIQHLAKRDENGNLVGIWGAMSDFSRSFQPWENFCEGLYLAGAECEDGAQPPEGWTMWTIPGYEYLRVKCEGGSTFSGAMGYLQESGLSLAGAVHDFTSPQTGENYMFFPIRKLL